MEILIAALIALRFVLCPSELGNILTTEEHNVPSIESERATIESAKTVHNNTIFVSEGEL
jgi:hypothetical protein